MIRVKASPAEIVMIDSVAARHNVTRSEIIRRAVKLLELYPEMMPPEPKFFRHDPTRMPSKEDFEQLYGPGSADEKPKGTKT